jgi:ubiquinone/menaquinone biosynthesis C-methylase UbiE
LTIPDMDHDTLQEHNRQWWDTNPMTYDWQGTLRVEPGTKEFYAAIDERFIRAHAHFGHPNYPAEPIFARQINYQARRGQRVLEIGCGMGAVAATMAQQGLDVTAIDITPTAVRMTRQRFTLMGLDGNILQADAERLPFRDASFDLVWAWGVIHHTANMAQAVNEIYRVLRPGGEVKVMVYYRDAMHNWMEAGLMRGVLKGEFLRKRYNDILREVSDGYIARHLTKEEMRQYFSAFENIRIELTDSATHIPGNRLVDQYLTGRIIPRRLKQRWDNWIMTHFGRFMYLEANRPANGQ